MASPFHTITKIFIYFNELKSIVRKDSIYFGIIAYVNTIVGFKPSMLLLSVGSL